LSEAIRERAASDLYRGLAELTEAVLQRDATWLMSQPAPGSATPAAVH